MDEPVKEKGSGAFLVIDLGDSDDEDEEEIDKEASITWSQFFSICLRRLATRPCQRFKNFTFRLVKIAILMFLIMISGAAIEKKGFFGLSKNYIDNAASTAWLYESPEVCATNGFGESLITYSTLADAHHNNELVSHCGSCGECSTIVDIDIYEKTRLTLTSTSKTCAMLAFIGKSSVYDCFKKDVGFTNECNNCWTENVMCDLQYCKFTCLLSMMIDQKNNDNESYLSRIFGSYGNTEGLNSCLLCDEKMCGTDFTICAGANRRKSGITSDINRDASNDEQVCSRVDVGWKERRAG